LENSSPTFIGTKPTLLNFFFSLGLSFFYYLKRGEKTRENLSVSEKNLKKIVLIIITDHQEKFYQRLFRKVER